jgi:hypothetical protein
MHNVFEIGSNTVVHRREQVWRLEISAVSVPETLAVEGTLRQKKVFERPT